jgi:group II intron reverse transcriptase/maturase/CRISPR-associated endonuclease Cas1
MTQPLVIAGKGPEAADLALRRVLRFKECRGPLVVLDWIGRGAPLLNPDNEGQLSKRPVTWCDLANRQRPTGLFGLRASDHLQQLLVAVLSELREAARVSLRDDIIAWAADVGVRLAEEGVVGLVAWHQALRRPEVRRWFPAMRVSIEDQEAVSRALAWALRFPAVYAVSEAPNHVSLVRALTGAQTTWLEIPVEHFEPAEHKLVTILVETALWDAIGQIAPPAPKDPVESPTILHLFPASATPGLVPALKATASSIRHVAVFSVATDRAPSTALKGWMESGADLWVVGSHGLSAGSLRSWISNEGVARVAKLRPRDVWVRSGVTGRAVVANVRRPSPAIPLPWRFRLYATRRRRASGIAQMSTAADRGARRTGRLYDRLCDKALLRSAWLRVAQGPQDSRGVDGVTIGRFKTGVDTELDSLVEELESRQYRARSLRRVVIPKAHGGRRELGISCIRDRVVQTACLSLLEPLFEPTFSHFSFAFRPRRSAHHAIALARSFIAAGNSWSVIADIERCFDTIDHDVLLERVSRRVPDPLMLSLIRHWLTNDVLDLRELVPSELGVPQGSPISPLLSNVYLDPLDRHFEERRVDFVRYADDIILFTKDEPKALEALHALGEFLHEPLHLGLKPAKTSHVRIDDGLDFLGFRLTQTTVTIQPEKLDRVTAALHASLAALGAPHASFLERTQTLGRINGLIRGFRAYFALPEERAITAQLRHVDRVVDVFAEETLPSEFRNDPAWLSRERFTTAVADDVETTTRRVHDIYPEERPAHAPQAWMVKPDNRQATNTAPPPSAEGRTDDAESERDPASSGVIEHNGRVYVMSHGSYVTEAAGALVIRRRKAEVYRRPLDEISLLFLQGLGTSVSVSLAIECARRDVAVVLAQPIGAPVAVLNPIDSARSHLRGRQVLRRNDPDVLRAGLRMLGAKIGNQASVLRYFAKYRAKTDAGMHTQLVAASDEVRELARRVTQIDPGKAGLRAMAMGFEGQAAAMYWSRLSSLLPTEIRFKGRVTQNADDPVNQAINYVYGMLYGEVWRALVRAGLDPYFGIMHGSERDQGSLVFDLIEEFRAPFADRLVVALISRGLKVETGKDGLRSRVRRLLAKTFIRAWTKKIRWRGQHVAPSTILERQAGALVKLINGDADYKPFRMRW